jgi:hypothetical protein
VLSWQKDIVVWFNIKPPSLGRYPLKLVFTTPFQSKCVQQIEERGKKIHLLVVSNSKIFNIPLMRIIGKIPNNMPWGILTTGETQQVQKRCLEGLIPTPDVMLKSNFRNITDLKSSMTRKLPQPLLIFFHSSTTYDPWTSFENHPPHMLPYLESTTTHHAASLSWT